MKIIPALLLSIASTTALARPLGDCVNSRNRPQVDEMKMALSNGLLSSVETSKLYTTENCGDYNKKLAELLDLSRDRKKNPASLNE